MSTRIYSGFRLLLPLVLGTQMLVSQPHPFSTVTALADWGFASPGTIRFGVLSVIHDPGNPRLNVLVLRPGPTPRQTTSSDHTGQGEKPKPGHQRTEPLSRATWVWNTDSLLVNPVLRDKTLSVIAGARFDRVFLQVPRNFSDDSSRDAGLRTLVQRFTAGGAKVYALSGGPEFTLVRNHPVVERTIGRIVSYNNSAPEGSRFAGFHLDAEPYLLPGFGGPPRMSILQQYLTLTRLAAHLCHSHKLLFGTDIPFWFNLPDEFSGTVDSVDFGGSRKTVNEFVTDWADEICVMSYRTKSSGANGIVTVARGELAYAEQQGKTVFIGLETERVPDEDHFYFRGSPATDTAMLGHSARVVVMTVSGDSVQMYLCTRPEAIGIFRRAKSDPARTVFLWEVSHSSHIPSNNLSFAKLGRRRLDETTTSVIRGLSGFDSFGGIAIHHAGSYATLPE